MWHYLVLVAPMIISELVDNKILLINTVFSGSLVILRSSLLNSIAKIFNEIPKACKIHFSIH